MGILRSVGPWRRVGWKHGYMVAGLVIFHILSANRLMRGAEPQSGPGWSQEQPAEGRYVQTEYGYMIPYTVTLPGTDVSFTMEPIPGGTFLMGSPEGEPGRSEAEGPQIEIAVAPFWMAKHEVTWAEYKQFMGLYSPLKSLQSTRTLLQSTTDNPRVVTQRERLLPLVEKQPELHAYLIQGGVRPADAVTIPTPLYDPSVTYESGEDPAQPAVTMSQFAAKQYSKWLSLLLGHDYRLPTEAEWEYACRAGSTTRYAFGDDEEQLGEYAWYEANADAVTHNVGEKKPNAWGLHDMHGNVMEWVLDAYSSDGYDHLEAGKTYSVEEAVRWPTELYPRVLRGGHWDSTAEDCRSAARAESADEDWAGSDPNVPLSPWWFTDYPAGAVGFRLLRPLQPMGAPQRQRVWEADVDSIRDDVDARLSEGRGVLENVSPNQPLLLKQLETVNESR